MVQRKFRGRTPNYERKKMKVETNAFLVRYSEGSYDEFQQVPIFTTDSEETAQKYVLKFNNILEKWKLIIYEAYDENLNSDYNIDKIKTIGFRYYDICEIHGANYIKIDKR